MYTALLLSEKSQTELKSKFKLPLDWAIKAHHVTINMGSHSSGPAASIPLGTEVQVLIKTIAQNDKVIAVGVETAVPSKNAIKHITLAVNVKNGATPKMSNELTNWREIPSPFYVTATLTELN